MPATPATSDDLVRAWTLPSVARLGSSVRSKGEIEDILGISTTERRRWLADGRLPSLGTRTMKLRGRGTITFHVFDPRVVEDILDGNQVDAWREEDAERAAKKRRLAAWKTRLKRAGNKDDGQSDKLHGWAEFERDGPLRRS